MPDITGRPNWDLRYYRQFSRAPDSLPFRGQPLKLRPHFVGGDRTRTICVTSSLQFEAGGTNPTLGDIAPLTGSGRESLLSETP